MKTTKLSNRNVMFTLNNSPDWALNLHLIMGETHNFIVDTGFGSNSVDPIIQYARQYNDLPFIYVNTHYHWDHIWGNGAGEKQFIVAHNKCLNQIKTHWLEMMAGNESYCDGDVAFTLPNLTFDEGFYFPEDGVRLIYTPGHTEDSISIFDEVDGVLNAGDNIGDTMEALVPELECKKGVYLETLLKYQKLPFETCISGHNRPLAKSEVNGIADLVMDKILKAV